ncbi:MAG TPA: endonuclease III [bacterium]|nr:endonuclease III [bacterium]
MPTRSGTRRVRSSLTERPASRARRAGQIIERLQTQYPDVRLPLTHQDPFQLLVATILSAQSTDALVNRVTPMLFARYPTAHALSAARPRDVERIIRPTGFFRQKTRAIIHMSQSLVERFGGHVPLTMEHLLTLEGVGRKTANVILSAKRLEAWEGGGDPSDGMGIVVDTHVRRLSQRLGLVTSGDVEKIEQQLMAIVPREAWPTFSLRLIYFGREVCTAKRPRCPVCPLNALCPSAPYRGYPPWMQARRTGGMAHKPGRKRQQNAARR